MVIECRSFVTSGGTADWRPLSHQIRWPLESTRLNTRRMDGPAPLLDVVVVVTNTKVVALVQDPRERPCSHGLG